MAVEERGEMYTVGKRGRGRRERLGGRERERELGRES